MAVNEKFLDMTLRELTNPDQPRIIQLQAHAMLADLQTLDKEKEIEELKRKFEVAPQNKK